MQNVNVNLAEFLNSVYGEPEQEDGRGVTIHRNRTEKIFQRLSSERLRSGRPQLGSDWMVSAWEAFNAVQGYVQHDSRRHGQVSDVDRILAASRDLNVQRAESVVMQLANAA